MHITCCQSLDKRSSSDLLIIPFWKGEPPVAAVELSDQLKKICLPPIRAKDFTGKEDDFILLWADLPEELRIALVGLGEKGSISVETLRRAYGKAVMQTRTKKIETISILVPQIETLGEKMTSHAMAEGIFSANYLHNIYKHDALKKDPQVPVKAIEWIGTEHKQILSAVDHAYKISKGVDLARDLANGNADDVTPQFLADTARKLAKDYPRVKTEVHDKKWLEQQKFGLVLAVSKASAHPPYFVTSSYQGNPLSKDHTVIVGKAITFDTGGLNLKPTGNIEHQKEDMSGAAAALGVIKAIAELELPINVTAVFAACENAIGSCAYKPGDVHVALSGRSVEIVNTDAEGRLTLADALFWTKEKLAPTRIIDIATLTGAMVVALGSEACGVMSNSTALAEELIRSGEKTFERCWRFPLFEEYNEQFKSDIADTKNAPTREGGAIYGALFLQEFVGKTPWAHLDIAGVASNKEAKRYLPKQATGFGVRLLVDFVEQTVLKNP